MAPPDKILVIGGGISGLACAASLHRRGLPVLLLERAPRFGGVIDAVSAGGFLFDVGPQSFLATAPLAAWIDELGLAAELLRANPRAPRYILSRGRLVRAPFGPGDLLRTPLLGWRTKLRLVAEPFHRTRPPAGDESLAAFVRRKFGEDLLSNLAAPFVSGVYAGDPERLSLPSAFPAIRRFEERHGSVLRGAIKSMRESKKTGSGAEGGEARAPLCNFRAGIPALVAAAAAQLGGAAIANAEVTALRRRSTAGFGGGFHVAFTENGVARSIEVSAIVVATPTDPAARLLATIEPRFVAALAPIEYAGVAQIATGYRQSQFAPRSPAASATGFGFLVPRTERLRLLGTVWNSFLFPGRAPDASASFTSFAGGATDPSLLALTDDEIAATICAELAATLAIAGPPVALHVARWPRAIPQYNLGHARIVAELDELCAHTPGVFLAGNYFAGPSLSACVEQAQKTAGAVVSYLGAQS